MPVEGDADGISGHARRLAKLVDFEAAAVHRKCTAAAEPIHQSSTGDP